MESDSDEFEEVVTGTRRTQVDSGTLYIIPPGQDSDTSDAQEDEAQPAKDDIASVEATPREFLDKTVYWIQVRDELGQCRRLPIPSHTNTLPSALPSYSIGSASDNDHVVPGANPHHLLVSPILPTDGSGSAIIGCSIQGNDASSDSPFDIIELADTTRIERTPDGLANFFGPVKVFMGPTPQDGQPDKRPFLSFGATGIRELKNVVLHHKLGSGGQATVYKGGWITRKSGRQAQFAVKVFDTGEQGLLEALACREIMRTGGHPNVVCVHWVDGGTPTSINTVIGGTCYDGGSLDLFLGDPRLALMSVLQPMMIQICEGLLWIHGIGFVHLDLKPANIFVKTFDLGKTVYKIGDFGLAQRFQEGSDGTLTGMLLGGTPYYVPPEAVKYGVTTFSGPLVDVYAFGMTIMELAASAMLIKGIPTAGDVASGLLPTEDETSASLCCDLLSSMIIRIPAGRIAVLAILLHPFLDLARVEDVPIIKTVTRSMRKVARV